MIIFLNILWSFAGAPNLIDNIPIDSLMQKRTQPRSSNLINNDQSVFSSEIETHEPGTSRYLILYRKSVEGGRGQEPVLITDISPRALKLLSPT